MAAQSTMPEPLAGIRVIEMTLAIQGPAAGVYLVDMGADVIKVEPPLGDPNRLGRGVDNDLPMGTMSAQFVACNRGKRSVCMDLTTDLARQALHALLATADVFLTNYRQLALDKLGLDEKTLKALYPDLIYASVNGFGPLGPDADKAMLDGAAVARGGLAGMTGYADRTPVLPAAAIGDHAGAMQLALGVMTALLVRERQGIAQRVQTSALGAQLWLQQWEITHASMTGARLNRAGPHHPNIHGPYGIYQTSDGGAIMIAQTMQEEAWDAFCIFADVPELSVDPRWMTPGKRLGQGATHDDSAEVRASLREAFSKKTTARWEEFLRTQPEIIWDRVRQWHEVLDDEQSIANGYVATVDVPNFRPTRVVGNLVTLGCTPGSVKGGPPELGEGNETILAMVGFNASDREIIKSRADAERERVMAALTR